MTAGPSDARPAAAPAEQRRRLTRAFLSSFFDNDLTVSAHDRKETFIWTMGLLASPGFIFPFLLAGASWGIVGRMTGFEVVRDITRDYRVVYLGFAMIGPGVVAALMWNHLLVDRRDALVLGVLPVRPMTVTRAKLLAVLAYVTAIAAVMHVPSSVAFGGLLSTGRHTLALSGGLAHFVSSFLASVSLLLAVTAAQALLVLVAGARRAPRLSGGLQVALVGAIFWLVATTPSVGRDVMAELGSAQARLTPWGIEITPAQTTAVYSLSPRLEASPPVWFFGLYESMLGAEHPVIQRMARRALLMVGGVALLTLAVYPLACRRLLVNAVADHSGFARTGRFAAGLSHRAAGLLARDPAGRAALQLLLATAGRLPRHRFVVAASAGAALAVALPAVLGPLPTAARDFAALRLLAVPFFVSTFVLVGLRLLIRTPGDVHANWIIAAADVPPRAIGRTLLRAFVAFGVVPWALACLPLSWYLWGPALALTQALLVAATGVLLASALLFRWSSMPCAEPHGRLDQGRTGRHVLLVGVALAWISALPAALPILAASPRALALLTGLLLLATAAVRALDRVVDPLPRQDPFASDTAFQILGLD